MNNPVICILCPAPVIEITQNVKDSIQEYTNQISSETIIESGGKGVNVMRVLSSLGIKTHLCTIIGGITGELFKSNLANYSKDISYLKCTANTRISTVINSEKSSYSHIIRGPILETNKDIWILFNKLIQPIISKCDFLIISGSLPNGFLKNSLPLIGNILSVKKNVKLFIDSPNIRKVDLIFINPYLIKPNYFEANKIFHFKNMDIKFLFDKVANNCNYNLIITDGDKGAYIKFNNEKYLIDGFQRIAKYPTGAGDALLAGLIYSEFNSNNTLDKIKLAFSICFSSLFVKSSGNIDLKGWQRGLYSKFRIKQLN